MRFKALLAVVVGVLAVLPGSVSGIGASLAAPPNDKKSQAARRAIVGDVKTWAIQYRRIRPLEIAASPFDLVVIDYRPDVIFGSEFPFSREDVALMQRKPDGSRRLVIAYLSVGEAEDYRSYWQRAWTGQTADRPTWIGTENPRWRGNFPVRFWQPAWPAILFGAPDRYLDRIVAAGFDGVYLDRIDVYQEFLDENRQAERDMVALLSRLSAHAHKLNPRFLVILQNAEELTGRPEVRAAIDVFAKEDLFYGIEHTGQPNTPEAIAASIKPMRALKASGTKILLIEYPQDAGVAADIRAKARREQFTLLLADRALGALAPVFNGQDN
jgi:cysteinyl-tRNA synthetase, unknown class